MDKEKLRKILIEYQDPDSLIDIHDAISQILELEGEEIKNDNIALGLISYDFESMKAERDRYQEALEKIAKGGADCNFQEIAIKALQG